MPTSYSDSLRLALPAAGELSGTWGAEVNTAITLMLEQAVAGVESIEHPDTETYTLVASDGVADEARNAVLIFTGTLTANRAVICPPEKKVYVVLNGTTGGFGLTVRTAGGTGPLIPHGASAIVACDGTDVLALLVGAPVFPTLDGTPLSGQQIAEALAAANKQDYIVSCSDLTTSLITTTSAGYFRVLNNATLLNVRASLLSPSTSGVVTIDILRNGTSVLSTLLTIDEDSKTSLEAAVPPEISDTELLEDDEITIDITTPGVNAKGLVVSLLAVGA